MFVEDLLALVVAKADGGLWRTAAVLTRVAWRRLWVVCVWLVDAS